MKQPLSKCCNEIMYVFPNANDAQLIYCGKCKTIITFNGELTGLKFDDHHPLKESDQYKK